MENSNTPAQLQKIVEQASQPFHTHSTNTHNTHMNTQVSNMENSNTPAELQKIVEQVIRNLKELPPVPSVGITDAPPPSKVCALRLCSVCVCVQVCIRPALA